jgi:aminoglycoside phosphotransferase (APT) family kinase protein
MIDIRQIWQKHDLGVPDSIEQTERGSANEVYIVDNAYIVRTDGQDTEARFHFKGEQRALECLQAADVPVPKVVAVDEEADYLITSKMRGEPLVDSWSALSSSAQERIARQAGSYLAKIHNVTFDQIGTLLHLGKFDTWYGYIDDYYRHHAGIALESGSITQEAYARGLAMVRDHKDFLDTVQTGHLVHNDYHFENVLQEDGEVTGIIDFEWALAGDPVWDLAMDDRWEDLCPGSRDYLYAAYREHCPVQEGDAERLRVYKMLKAVEYMCGGGVAADIEEARTQFYRMLV